MQDAIAINSPADALAAVAEARQAAGISQADLEHNAGMGERYITALHAGRYDLTLKALLRILTALGLALVIVRAGPTPARPPNPSRTRRDIVIRSTTTRNAPAHDFPSLG